jgi:hypothetical protein
MNFRRIGPLVLAALLVAGFACEGIAQGQAKSAPASEQKSKGDTKDATSPAPSTTAQGIPEGTAISILIRRTLMTLNDANLSGNYTVLRDLAAPGFQSANNAAKLGEIFATLRNRGLDFAPIMYFDPKLVREPEIGPNGMLRVSGFIPSQPQQVNFDMMFQKIEERWRLFGIAVNTSPSAAAFPAAAPASTGEAKK